VRIVTERFIFCKGERLAYSTISLITNKYNAQVFPHLRIKEVANRDWIKEEDFDYALKGHIDFTVAVDFRPVIAIELDGKFHQSEKARERDKKKDALCDSLAIPLVRLDSGQLRPELLQPILAEVVEHFLDTEKAYAARPTAHEHAIMATPLQLEDMANYNRDQLSLPEADPWELKITSRSLENGYSEATVDLVFPTARIQIGRGRSKLPHRTLMVCGRSLAEQIAIADAGAYIRTLGFTTRDTMVDSLLPLSAQCQNCMERRRGAGEITPPRIPIHQHV
jgi:hypothetical protein